MKKPRPTPKRSEPIGSPADAKFPDYLLPVVDDLNPIYRFVDSIAAGKNAHTYKIQARSSQHFYCLKTISPTVTDPAERERIRATLAKEVAILQPLSHRCLPRIYEKRLTGALPYYVCTFHPGETLERFRAQDKRLRVEEAVFVIVSLIDALDYIHINGRTHCDLHQDNILLSDKVFAEGLMVIDFGAGHRGSDSSDVTPDRGTIHFKDVKGMARHRQSVNRDLFDADFRANDIRAFGRALALMERCFFSHASHDQLLSYREFARLLDDGTFNSWQDVRNHFDHVIDPDAFMTRTERFFVMKDGSRPSITLPAADPIPVGEAVLAVINCASFQRLRTIKQLSFCEWYFPGATHSRFEHCLGTFGMARRALTCLSRDSHFTAKFNQTNVNGTLLASLLHDVGHYPFAHVIEHYVSARYSLDKAVRENVHHFNHTLHLIDNDDHLKQAIDTFWGEETRAEATRILLGRIPALSEVLDGPVDCDKLDYLRRDAHHAGVPYGSGLDIPSILGSFRCSPAGNNLVVASSAVHAIEGFMIVQDQMLTAVYWHETIRAVFAMFHRFLDGCLADSKEKLSQLVGALKKCSSEHDAFEQVVIPLLKSAPGRARRNDAGSPVGRASQEELEPLVRLHRVPNFTDIYRPVARYSALDPEDPKKPPNPFWNVFTSIVPRPSLAASSVPIQWPQVRRLRNCFEEAFREKGNTIGRFDVLVDVPWGKASNRVVTVLDSDGRNERPINEVSHLASTIFTDPTAYSAPIRVYVSPRLFTQFEHSLYSIRASAEERYFGRAAFEDGGEPF